MTWLDESSDGPETETAVLAAADPGETFDAMPDWFWEAVSRPRSEGQPAPDAQEN